MQKSSTEPNEIITVKDLTKNFGSFHALNGLNLTVKKGEVHGFLGPNGAGKSTTIRILLGLLRKTDGEAMLFGEDPWAEATKLHKRLAYVPGEVNFWPNLSGGEVIDLLGSLRGNGINKKRRAELLERFKLDPTRKFHTYSKGNRQKVALVAGLTADVELYVLDEPTSGLDPLMEAVFQDVIRELKAEGKTILLSSHILAEVEALCDTVTIIREGKTVKDGTLADLRKLHHNIMTVETSHSLEGLEKLEGVHSVRREKHGEVRFEVDDKHIPEILRFLSQYDVKHLTSHHPTLEDLFLRQYGLNEEEEA